MKKLLKPLCVLLTALLLGSVLPFSVLAAGETDYTVVDPYAAVDWETWGQYKANLHTHSTFSDGEFTLPDMVEKYYNMGYDILAMTDHGVINYGWNRPHNTFPPFCWANHVEGHPLSKKYHVEANMTDEGYARITLGADRGGRGMVDVTGGIEMNMAVISKTHVNGYFLEEGSWGEGEWGTENSYAAAVEGVENDGREGYTVLNHVGDWLDSDVHPERAHDAKNIAYFADIFINNPSCLGMEIVNNNDRVTAQDRALWDELLQVVIPQGRNITAFADDDSETEGEMGHTFEMFPLEENTLENVKTAMLSGAFFCCSRFDKSDPENKIEGPGGYGNPEFVPLVQKIEVDQAANTITVRVLDDETRPCRFVSWIADGAVIQKDTELTDGCATIDLNDYEDLLGCYIRFQLGSENGVTYSQAFELKYDGRAEKEKAVPYEAVEFYTTPVGRLVKRFIETRFFSVLYIVWEKLWEKINHI
ncbi:MAG: hypothetical protein IJK23_09070 [Clostridia bacterium]|nr:hypothetical protein [Clostridia bacterium]